MAPSFRLAPYGAHGSEPSFLMNTQVVSSLDSTGPPLSGDIGNHAVFMSTPMTHTCYSWCRALTGRYLLRHIMRPMRRTAHGSSGVDMKHNAHKPGAVFGEEAQAQPRLVLYHCNHLSRSASSVRLQQSGPGAPAWTPSREPPLPEGRFGTRVKAHG